MASSLYFIVVLCLTSGLWAGADAQCRRRLVDCCESCPLGWSQFGSRCFKFHYTEKEWSDAEDNMLPAAASATSSNHRNKMASSLFFIVVLCLTSGLCAAAKARCSRKSGTCCETCPSGWTQVESRCFMFHFVEKDWSDAEITCVGLGGNLASIRTDADYPVLREIANRVTGTDKATWLGGHDAVKEGAWKWSDGSNFNFTAWYQNEPNNHGNAEHCMEMNFREKDYVNDMSCSQLRSFICSKDAEYELW